MKGLLLKIIVNLIKFKTKEWKVEVVPDPKNTNKTITAKKGNLRENLAAMINFKGFFCSSFDVDNFIISLHKPLYNRKIFNAFN